MSATTPRPPDTAATRTACDRRRCPGSPCGRGGKSSSSPPSPSAAKPTTNNPAPTATAEAAIRTPPPSRAGLRRRGGRSSERTWRSARRLCSSTVERAGGWRGPTATSHSPARGRAKHRVHGCRRAAGVSFERLTGSASCAHGLIPSPPSRAKIHAAGRHTSPEGTHRVPLDNRTTKVAYSSVRREAVSWSPLVKGRNHEGENL
jgi:hypothetical protein